MKGSLAVLCLFVPLAMLGCADENRGESPVNTTGVDVVNPGADVTNTGTPASLTGMMKFSVAWPAQPPRSSSTRWLINPDTQRLLVRVRRVSDSFTVFADILRPSAECAGNPETCAPASPITVPLGTYRVDILAFKDITTLFGQPSPALLSFGFNSNVVVGVENDALNPAPAHVTLSASSIAFVPSSTPILYGSTASVQIQFTNWPLEFRQVETKVSVTDMASFDQLLCSLPVIATDVTARDCLNQPIPFSDPPPAPFVNFYVEIDGVSFARNFGSGSTLYPAGSIVSRSIIVFSSDFLAQ